MSSGEVEQSMKKTLSLSDMLLLENAAQHPKLKPELHTQMEQVRALIKAEHLIDETRVDQEIDWFYGGLGLDPYYFETNTAKEVASHIVSLYAAKLLAQSNGTELELQLQSQKKGKALYVARSMPGYRMSPCVAIEQTIEEVYLGLGFRTRKDQNIKPITEGASDRYWKLQTFRTSGAIAPQSKIHLRLYFLSEPVFKNPKVNPTETRLDEIADNEFLSRVDPTRKKVLEEMVTEAVHKPAPVIKVFDTDKENQKELLILFSTASTHSFFSGITDLYHGMGLFSASKYVDHFSNGLTLMSFHLQTIKSEDSFNKAVVSQLIEQANLVYILPRTSITPLVQRGVFNTVEHVYAYAAWKFAFQFLGRQSNEFAELAIALKDNPIGSGLLAKIKSAIRKEAYTEGRVLEALFEYPDLVKECYKDFERYHSPRANTTNAKPLKNNDLLTKIIRTVHGELDQQILLSFLTFNQSILKTNFYKSTKVALSFRLTPSFLNGTYPIVPFGVFLVLGAEFRGYHVRFRDIARGGIRVIRSHNLQAFVQNVTTLFDENYNLAATQDRKNKDIPEGGSKGTILLSADHQDKSFTAFKKYIDSLLDVLQPDSTVIDHFGKEEILFLGPDEGTADMMNWASQHAKERGFKFWKAFTTGKSRERGGIPHDTYGMTTRSIHQYVLGILEKLGLDESQCTKFQTGGPDGDLGSNEIKISKDKTVGIVDGSGVLYDPVGLDKQELLRCAGKRIMARNFDKSKLSPQGWFVDVEDVDKKLPDGTVVHSGFDFRNNFHINPLATADIFVPCGGRPESVNMSNVSTLIDPETKRTRFKIIVEGANLFFTQEARLLLEKQGVIIFKDASANKGGVTSSSLEVLAALSLTDSEFEQHMTVKDGVEPKFYKDYVEEVQRIIEANARREFECLWAESQRSGTPKSILSDTISFKIVELSTSIAESDLWKNEEMKKRILKEYCPKTLLSLVGSIDKIIERVPESYCRALFSRYVASRYVYLNGTPKNPEFAFFSFLQQFLH